MKIGFIGLGAMGQGIARNLLKAGHELTVWNRSPGPAQALAAEGARVAAAPADALKGELLISMLANDAAIDAVGLNGPLLKVAAPGLIHINMSTISVETAEKIADAHAVAGVGYIACPVLGRPDAAATAQLFLIAGGDPVVLEKVRPVLAPLGRELVVAGDKPEHANLFKIATNFMTMTAIEAYGEAITLLRKGGVDPEIFYNAMSAMYYSGSIHKLYGRIVIDEAYDPAGFKLKHGYKDAGLALAAAKKLESPLPLASKVHDFYLEAMARGFSEKDWAMIAKLAAERAGL